MIRSRSTWRYTWITISQYSWRVAQARYRMESLAPDSIHIMPVQLLGANVQLFWRSVNHAIFKLNEKLGIILIPLDMLILLRAL